MRWAGRAGRELVPCPSLLGSHAGSTADRPSSAAAESPTRHWQRWWPTAACPLCCAWRPSCGTSPSRRRVPAVRASADLLQAALAARAGAAGWSSSCGRSRLKHCRGASHSLRVPHQRQALVGTAKPPTRWPQPAPACTRRCVAEKREWRNPFLPYEQALWVADLGGEPAWGDVGARRTWDYGTVLGGCRPAGSSAGPPTQPGSFDGSRPAGRQPPAAAPAPARADHRPNPSHRRPAARRARAAAEQVQRRALALPGGHPAV